MHFERHFFFQNAYKYFFPEKEIIKNICVPTLPKIFRPVARNTLLFLFGMRSPILINEFIEKQQNGFIF